MGDSNITECSVGHTIFIERKPRTSATPLSGQPPYILCTIRTASLHRNTSCALSGQPPYTGTPPVHYPDSLPTQEHLLCTIRTASLHRTPPVHYPDSLPTQEHLLYTIRTASLHRKTSCALSGQPPYILCTIRTASLHRNTSCALSGQPPYTGTPPVHYPDSLPTQEHLLCTIWTASLHRNTSCALSGQPPYTRQAGWCDLGRIHITTSLRGPELGTGTAVLQASQLLLAHTHTYPLSLAWTSAPCWSKYSTVATRLNPAAKCKGVEYLPLTSQQLTFCGVLRRCKESKIALG